MKVLARGTGGQGTRRVDDVVVGQVEAARAVARRGDVGRRGLLLDYDLGSRGAAGSARGRAVRRHE